MVMGGRIILSKVVGNPRNLLLFDFIRENNHFGGDFADFINQSIEFTQLAKGIRIPR